LQERLWRENHTGQFRSFAPISANKDDGISRT
jgi:hypothetical protein